MFSTDVIRENIDIQDIEAVEGGYPSATWVQAQRLYDPAFKPEIKVEVGAEAD